jgi:hypothetical protein
MNEVSEETRKKWREKIETILEALNLGFIELNEWESKFIDSVWLQINTMHDLSFKQSSALNRIYEKVQ